MTKKELYLDLTNKSEKDIDGITQVWIDSELEKLTGISKSTWTNNYKMNTPLKKGVMMQLKVNEMQLLLENTVQDATATNDIDRMIVCSLTISDIEHFLNREEK